MPDHADESYRAGYRQGLADAGQSAREVSPQRRYAFAALTFVVGIGGALTTLALASPKHRHVAGVILFSGAVLGSTFGAAHILADKNPQTPNLRIRV